MKKKREKNTTRRSMYLPKASEYYPLISQPEVQAYLDTPEGQGLYISYFTIYYSMKIDV